MIYRSDFGTCPTVLYFFVIHIKTTQNTIGAVMYIDVQGVFLFVPFPLIDSNYVRSFCKLFHFFFCNFRFSFLSFSIFYVVM